MLTPSQELGTSPNFDAIHAPGPERDRWLQTGTYAITLAEYDPEIAAGIGALMPQLDPGFSGLPTPRDHLERVVRSSEHAQLVAFHHRRVVGAAVMSAILGSGVRHDAVNEKGWLEDFVVDEASRGKGIADHLWDHMLMWCQTHNLSGFELKTEPWREAAVKFYERKGAQLLDATEDSLYYWVPLSTLGEVS